MSEPTAPQPSPQALTDYVTLAHSVHVSLVGYTPRGVAAPTRTRVAPYAGRLVGIVTSRSAVLERIRLGDDIRCAPCELDGALLAEPIAVAARIMERAELPVVKVALAAKYGWWMRAGLALRRLRQLLSLRRTTYVGVELSVE
ncbi:MAG: hypothetical protein ACRD3Q_13635 [Terriglobales bacterium]